MIKRLILVLALLMTSFVAHADDSTKESNEKLLVRLENYKSEEHRLKIYISGSVGNYGQTNFKGVGLDLIASSPNGVILDNKRIRIGDLPAHTEIPFNFTYSKPSEFWVDQYPSSPYFQSGIYVQVKLDRDSMYSFSDTPSQIVVEEKNDYKYSDNKTNLRGLTYIIASVFVFSVCLYLLGIRGMKVHRVVDKRIRNLIFADKVYGCSLLFSGVYSVLFIFIALLIFTAINYSFLESNIKLVLIICCVLVSIGTVINVYSKIVSVSYGRKLAKDVDEDYWMYGLLHILIPLGTYFANRHIVRLYTQSKS